MPAFEEDKAPSTDKPKLRAAPKPKEDSPPKESKASGRPRGRPPGLEKQITEFYQSIGMGVGFFNMDDGVAVMEAAEPAGKAWAELAQKNAKVKQAWETILTGSAWSAIVMVHAPLAYTIARNHNLAPELHNPLASTNGDTPPPVG